MKIKHWYLDIERLECDLKWYETLKYCNVTYKQYLMKWLTNQWIRKSYIIMVKPICRYANLFTVLDYSLWSKTWHKKQVTVKKNIVKLITWE